MIFIFDMICLPEFLYGFWRKTKNNDALIYKQFGIFRRRCTEWEIDFNAKTINTFPPCFVLEIILLNNRLVYFFLFYKRINKSIIDKFFLCKLTIHNTISFRLYCIEIVMSYKWNNAVINVCKGFKLDIKWK